MTRVSFRFDDVLPADDPVAQWAATIGLAFNDLALVHERLEADEKVLHRWFYWLRLVIAHFDEAAKFLAASDEVLEVREFIASLPAEVRAHHRDCLERFERRLSEIEQIRNEVGFHYPPVKRRAGQRKKQPVRAILAALAKEQGQVEKGQSDTIREARLLFADDIASSLFLRATGG